MTRYKRYEIGNLFRVGSFLRNLVMEQKEFIHPALAEKNTENCSGEILPILSMNGTIQEKRKLMLKSRNFQMACRLQII